MADAAVPGAWRRGRRITAHGDCTSRKSFQVTPEWAQASLASSMQSGECRVGQYSEVMGGAFFWSKTRGGIFPLSPDLSCGASAGHHWQCCERRCDKRLTL